MQGILNGDMEITEKPNELFASVHIIDRNLNQCFLEKEWEQLKQIEITREPVRLP